MRIYEGSPRQDWEEVLRAIGAFADREQLKELLLLELDEGFLLQGLALPPQGMDSDTFGSLTKRTYELLDDQIAQLMDEAEAHRGTADGAYIDGEKARDVFLLEQEGSFVLRLLHAGSAGLIGHRLAEFTKEEILAMIEAAPDHRHAASAKQPKRAPAVEASE
jgi:hypothetical protein